MKKNYQKPTTFVVKIEQQFHLLQNSQGISTVRGNANLNFEGGSSDAARTKSNTMDWEGWQE